MLPLSGLVLASALAVSAAPKPVPIVQLSPAGDSAIVVGASQGSRWVGWEKAGKLITAGRLFQFYNQNGTVRVARVKKPELSQASGSAFNVDLATKLATRSPLIGMAGATWKPVPRIPKRLDPRAPDLTAAVAELLRSKGVAKPRVVIQAAWEVDLDGDGSSETLISARSPGYAESGNPDGPARLSSGAFSGVFLRRKAEGKSATSMVAGEVYPKVPEETPAANLFELSQVIDLNGDGSMEIVISSHYYEGGGVVVAEWKGGKLKGVLSCADGA